jgi:hypothetical protein
LKRRELQEGKEAHMETELGWPLWLKRGANLAGSALIAFLFTVMVMAATAQQETLARMKAAEITAGYSSAYALSQQAKTSEERRATLESDEH